VHVYVRTCACGCAYVRLYLPLTHTLHRFVEFAFSSATPNMAVALSYAGSDRSSVFEIEVGDIDRGADISTYSQYPQACVGILRVRVCGGVYV